MACVCTVVFTHRSKALEHDKTHAAQSPLMPSPESLAVGQMFGSAGPMAAAAAAIFSVPAVPLILRGPAPLLHSGLPVLLGECRAPRLLLRCSRLNVRPPRGGYNNTGTATRKFIVRVKAEDGCTGHSALVRPWLCCAMHRRLLLCCTHTQIHTRPHTHEKESPTLAWLASWLGDCERGVRGSLRTGRRSVANWPRRAHFPSSLTAARAAAAAAARRASEREQGCQRRSRGVSIYEGPTALSRTRTAAERENTHARGSTKGENGKLSCGLLYRQAGSSRLTYVCVCIGLPLFATFASAASPWLLLIAAACRLRCCCCCCCC